jgi:Fe2+ transport system protein B
VTRSGDEPSHARSPLRLRRGLAGFGLVTALVAALVVSTVAPWPVVVLFLVVALVAALDLVIIGRRLRQGPHFQPGPEIPPYRPLEPEPRARPVRAPLTESDRIRRYLTLMGTCLLLLVVAWGWVQFHSRTIALLMSLVAAVLPPIAVIVANFGVRLPSGPEPGPDRGDAQDRPD